MTEATSCVLVILCLTSCTALKIKLQSDIHLAEIEHSCPKEHMDD